MDQFDIDSLEEWIEETSSIHIRLVAVRCALRILGFIIDEIQKDHNIFRRDEGVLLASLMTCIRLSCSTVFDTPFRSDAMILDTFYDDAGNRTKLMYGSIVAMRSANSLTSSTTRMDSETLLALFDEHSDMVDKSSMLLDNEISQTVKQLDAPTEAFYRKLFKGSSVKKSEIPNANFPGPNDGVWSFWESWYKGFLKGSPVDWELQRRIALIDDDIWDQGAASIAKEIASIEAHYFLEKAPIAETIEINPETGYFRSVPVELQNVPLLSRLTNRVRDAIEDAVVGSNGLSERSLEIRVLSRAIDRYGNDPQRMELDFTSCAIGLRRQIYETLDLAESAENRALLDAVEEGARGIRATHPDVALCRDILARQVLRELSETHKHQLEAALPLLESLSEGQLAEDFTIDVPLLFNDALLPLRSLSPKLPGADVTTRVFNRATKMTVIWQKLLDKSASLHDSREHKAAKVLLTGGAVLTSLYAIVQIGLWVFGVI